MTSTLDTREAMSASEVSYRPDVAVVGGGLAGIAAALDCADAGARVVMLESRRRLGGAAYSTVRHGLRVDNGQHVFLRCCTEYRDLLERIGATADVVLQPRLQIAVLSPGHRPASLTRSGLPAPLHLAGSLLRYPFVSARDRVALARSMRALDRLDTDDPAVDARSFGDWLREQGQSRAAIERLWELIARPTLNLRCDDASLAQAAQVFQTGLLRDREAGDIGWAGVPLSDIHDRAARRALTGSGVRVRLGCRARSIVVGNDGALRIEADCHPTLEVGAVIVAVPHERAARLLRDTGAATPDLAPLGSSPIVELHVVYDRPVLGLPFAAAVNSPVQYVFDRTASAGATHGQYLAVSLSAADEEVDMTVEDLRERFAPALAALLPAARSARIVDFFVTREHFATFRASPNARARRPGTGTGRPGLFLAGSHTDTGWPATMEGAVRSGRAAAREALASLSAARRGRWEVMSA